MPPVDQPLPEGTDHIIEGAGVSARDEIEIGAVSDRPAAAAGDTDARSAVFGRFDDIKGQTNDKVRAFAEAGKDRATSALDDLIKMIGDAAGEVDGRLGSQYGDYARSAASGLGSFSESFKGKDVDQIFDEARELVKKSPGVAIGIAAALGFVVARIARSGLTSSTSANDAGKDAPAA
jgi:ElaB/YqjD/DUF883 family membrane-anchored ribosome-binding protein